MKWTKRNEDKPHRCPSCHAICLSPSRTTGPRTVLKCPDCQLQWRHGTRTPRRRTISKRSLAALLTMDIPCSCYEAHSFRIVDHVPAGRITP